MASRWPRPGTVAYCWERAAQGWRPSFWPRLVLTMVGLWPGLQTQGRVTQTPNEALWPGGSRGRWYPPQSAHIIPTPMLPDPECPQDPLPAALRQTATAHSPTQHRPDAGDVNYKMKFQVGSVGRSTDQGAEPPLRRGEPGGFACRLTDDLGLGRQP